MIITEQRRLPIPTEHREFTVKVDGEEVPRGQHLLTVSINSTIDHIAFALLVYQDGAAATGGFELSSSELFIPGKEIEISAGTGNENTTLFKGILTRHSLKVRSNTAPQLIVEAKHAAIKMTIKQNCACFFDETDADVISQLFDTAGIRLEAETTSITQKQLVQYQSTDWDFCLLRARINGKHLITQADQMLLKAIDTSGEASMDLVFGATILDADFRMDTRHQYAAVETSTWDMANQEINIQEGEDPGLSDPGNIAPSDLAQALGLDKHILRHSQLQEDEALTWASSVWQASQASRVDGRVKCEGIGAVQVGDIVKLAGVGERFNGKAFVTAVRHDFDLVQGWKTHLQFGGIEPIDSLAKSIAPPLASGLLPAINGLHIGVVVSNEDPDNEYRVRIHLPLIESDQDGVWARVSSLDAGAERGSFFRPEIGDEVIVGFFNNDPRAAVILGMLHSSAKPAPLEGSDDNHEKVIQSRSKMKWLMNDDTVEMLFETPKGNRLSLSEDKEALLLEDQHGNSITLDQDGITLKSSKAINLQADTEVSLEAATAFSVSAGSELKLEGSASAELSSSAQTTVRGGVVQIN